MRAADIAAAGGGEKDLAITFDDAATSVATAAEPILSECNIPGRSSRSRAGAITRPVGKKDLLCWRELGDLLSKGAEIGGHSVTHPDFGPDRSRSDRR